MTPRRFRRDRTGSTTVEFAIVGTLLCMVTFAMVEAGTLWWLKTGMQLTASMTARCGAVGYTDSTANSLSNFACTNSSTTQNYAVNTVAAAWGIMNLSTSSVTLGGTNGKVSGCNGAPGNFFSVTISQNYTFPPPLGNFANLSSSACYPMP